jgi:hypothetical protein
MGDNSEAPSGRERLRSNRELPRRAAEPAGRQVPGTGSLIDVTDLLRDGLLLLLNLRVKFLQNGHHVSRYDI